MMNSNIKVPNGQSPFKYTKVGAKQSYTSKEVKQAPSFCVKKHKQSTEQMSKTQHQPIITFKPEFHPQIIKKASLNINGYNIVSVPLESVVNIQFKDIKDGKDKQKQQRRNSLPKRIDKLNLDCKGFNRTESPRYFGLSQQQSTSAGFSHSYSSPFKQKQIKLQNMQVGSSSEIKLIDDPPTPNKSTTKLSQDQINTTIKQSENPQTNYKKQTEQIKAPQEEKFVNKANAMAKLAYQLNQKQRRITELQNKLIVSKNQFTNLEAEHARQLIIQQREKSQLLKEKKQLQYQVTDLKNQNSELKTLMSNQNHEFLILNQSAAVHQLKLSEALSNNEKLEVKISKINEIKEILISQEIINEVQKQLQSKSQRIVQLEKYNQSILIELEKVKKQIIKQPVPTPVFSLPEQGNFNIFQQAFKTYISQTQKYKQTIKEKQKQIELTRQKYNLMRIENERLKNQLKIEELRRQTDLKHNSTISTIQRQSIMNELKDTKRQLTLSKEKTKALNSQIKTKDDFIMKNIKVNKGLFVYACNLQ